jgi:hypothetical protein
MAGSMSYAFSVPDENHARLLAGALADFGFPQVSAHLDRTDGWEVTVVDDCRQYEQHESRQREAVRRQAMAIARHYLGHGSGPTIYSPPGRPVLAQSSPPILLLNPDRHPPVPVVPSVLTPLRGPLSLKPDLPELTRPDFAELQSTRWDELDHAYLEESLPELISDLVLGEVEWGLHFGNLVLALIHQGTLYPATAPALTVLGRLAAAGSLEAAGRRDVYVVLLAAAGRLRVDVVDDTDYALAEDREPRAQQWAGPVRQAVEAITPALLARWDVEPSACRLVLAGLAAEFPGPGAALVDQVAVAADEYRGTQTGEYFKLAWHLIRGEATTALAVASAITSWNEHIRADRIDDDSIGPGLRAIEVLSEAVGVAAYRAF